MAAYTGKVASPDKTVTGNGTFSLGQGSKNAKQKRVLHLIPNAGATGNVTVKAKHSVIADGTDTSLLPIPYIKRVINGTVADDSKASAAIALNVGGSIIEIEDDGLEIALVVAGAAGTDTLRIVQAKVQAA